MGTVCGSFLRNLVHFWLIPLHCSFSCSPFVFDCSSKTSANDVGLAEVFLLGDEPDEPAVFFLGDEPEELAELKLWVLVNVVAFFPEE